MLLPLSNKDFFLSSCQIMREAEWGTDPLIDLENSRGGNEGGAGGGSSAPPQAYSKVGTLLGPFVRSC